MDDMEICWNRHSIWPAWNPSHALFICVFNCIMFMMCCVSFASSSSHELTGVGEGIFICAKLRYLPSIGFITCGRHHHRWRLICIQSIDFWSFLMVVPGAGTPSSAPTSCVSRIHKVMRGLVGRQLYRGSSQQWMYSWFVEVLIDGRFSRGKRLF